MINLILKSATLYLFCSRRTSKFNLIHFRFLHNPITNRLGQDSPFIASYLINSCALSTQTALSTAKESQLENAQDSDLVVELLKSYEFTNAHITKLVAKYPRLLQMKLEKTLKPKIDYFQSIGYSNLEIATLISHCPSILQPSLENRLKPNFELLVSIIGNTQKVAAVFRQNTRLLRSDLRRSLVPNIDLLRSHGVSDLQIAKFVMKNSRIVLLGREKFVKLVEFIKEKGFNPKSSMFCHGVAAVARLNSWNDKVSFYKSLGWSEEEVMIAFARHPYFMSVSEEKIKKLTDFYSQKFMWGPSYVAKYPVLISFSLEKRVLPRYMVLNVLISRGLDSWKSNAHTFVISEKVFWCKYVAAHMNDVPEVLDVYKRSGGPMFDCSIYQ